MKFSEILEGGKEGTISLRPGRRTWGKTPKQWAEECISDTVMTDRNEFLRLLYREYPDLSPYGPYPDPWQSFSFNIFIDEGGQRQMAPSIGNVEIGQNVVINNGVTICKGLVGTTRIGDNTMIDGNVYIGHDCQIGEGVTIILNAGLAGYVKVDNGAWIGPGATVARRVHIGENAFVAAGAVVLTDVPANARVMGNPAKQIMKHWSKK